MSALKISLTLDDAEAAMIFCIKTRMPEMFQGYLLSSI
jgi:hypothetical protein